jgi:PBP1b-binding outer membrane lipoprotein LpoB
MSEGVTTVETEKKPKKVVKKIIVKRIVKRKKKDIEGDGEGDNKSIEAKVAMSDPIVSEMKPSVNVNPVDRYVDSMDDMTRKAMEIARDHLESSFNMNKCNGYLDYLESSA